MVASLEKHKLDEYSSIGLITVKYRRTCIISAFNTHTWHYLLLSCVKLQDQLSDGPGNGKMEFMDHVDGPATGMTTSPTKVMVLILIYLLLYYFIISD